METVSRESVHPDDLEEKPPVLIMIFYHGVQNFLTSYGWYLLAQIILILLLWLKFLKPAYEKWKQKREDREYAARYHRDPDAFISTQEKMEKARQKMQENYDLLSKVHAEKTKQREEIKRSEWLSRQVGESGQRLGDGSKKTFKPEYHPLMGPGSSGGYRPAKRGCPGGGCGKK